MNDPTYFFESLGYLVPDRTLDPYLAEFVPLKKNVEVRSHVHAGFEFLYVLAGEMEIRHGSQAYNLEPGDSVYFDASTPHSYRCGGNDKATVIIVTQHQTVMPQPSMNLRPLGSSLTGAVRSGVAASQLEKRGTAEVKVRQTAPPEKRSRAQESSLAPSA